jgi:hypothetical protein
MNMNISLQLNVSPTCHTFEVLTIVEQHLCNEILVSVYLLSCNVVWTYR